MIQFGGSKTLEGMNNGCVAPAFACGISPYLGNKVNAVEAAGCRNSTHGNWTFFDFTSTDCPLQYGFYLAFYNQTCDTDRCLSDSRTGTFGLLEVMESSQSLSFDSFVAHVKENNPSDFLSEGVQTYTTTAGDVIEFEVHPSTMTTSSLVSLNGEPFGRDTRTWPMVRGNVVQSTTPGRFTFDSPDLGKRLILDMTHPTNPVRLYKDLPSLTKEGEVGSKIMGTFFDDSGVVYPGLGIEFIEVTYFAGKLRFMRIQWRDQRLSEHGASWGLTPDRLDLLDGDFIAEVGIGSSTNNGIDYLSISTHFGSSLVVGSSTNPETFALTDASEEIVAFYGHSNQNGIFGLGVVYTTAF